MSKSRKLVVLTLALCACASLAAPALAWWNTGLVNVRNQSSRQVSVFPKYGGNGVTQYPDYDFGENTIPPNRSRYFAGAIISWCDNTYELQTKGWEISYFFGNEEVVVARLCQNYRDDTVYIVPEGGAWEDRRKCASGPFSYIDLIVRADGTLVCSG